MYTFRYAIQRSRWVFELSATSTQGVCHELLQLLTDGDILSFHVSHCIHVYCSNISLSWFSVIGVNHELVQEFKSESHLTYARSWFNLAEFPHFFILTLGIDQIILNTCPMIAVVKNVIMSQSGAYIHEVTDSQESRLIWVVGGRALAQPQNTVW